MTLAGFIFPFITGLYQLNYDLTFTKPVPQEFFFLLCFSFFWFQTCDAVDGKQARRTQNCSPLGQILDHSLDQVAYLFFYLGVVQIYMMGTGPIYELWIWCSLVSNKKVIIPVVCRLHISRSSTESTFRITTQQLLAR